MRQSLAYTAMSKRTFMATFGRALKPIRAGTGSKIWFDKRALDRLIDEMASKPIEEWADLTDDDREHVRRQMMKRLS